MRLLTLLVLALFGLGPVPGPGPVDQGRRGGAAHRPLRPRRRPGARGLRDRRRADQRRRRRDGRRQEDADRARAARRRVGRHQDRRAAGDAGRAGRGRLPGRLRLRPARGRRLGGREEQDRLSRHRLRAEQDPPAGLPLSLLAVLEVARHRQAHPGPAGADPGRRAAQDRGDLPGEDGLGPGDGRRVGGGGQGRRLPGGGAGRVRAGRQGLLRSHPQGQGRQRRRRVRHSHAARRHDDDQADEGARLQRRR